MGSDDARENAKETNSSNYVFISASPLFPYSLTLYTLLSLAIAPLFYVHYPHERVKLLWGQKGRPLRQTTMSLNARHEFINLIFNVRNRMVPTA